MRKDCFKGCFCSKGGFTLIELLVVVLIIGILAAVALPQYRKAVLKSRAAEAVTVLPSLRNAALVYYLANGEQNSEDIDKLDVEVPDGRKTTSWMGKDDNDPDHYYYSCVDGGCGARAANPDLPIFHYTGVTGLFFCIRHTTNSDMAENICKSMGTFEEKNIPNHTYYKL